MNFFNSHSASIYLSGGMQHSQDLGAGWRSEVSKWLVELGYTPIDIAAMDIAYANVHGDMYRALESHEDLLERKSNIRRHYIYADIQLIKDHTDALIIYYDESVRRGAGTISECQIAYDRELPIFLVNGFDNLNDIPGWLQGLTTKIFASFDELKVYMANLPAGILKKDRYGNHSHTSYYLCSLSGEVFEKNKSHFVSKVSPLYSAECVDIVKQTFENHKDRYEFFMEYLADKLIPQEK